ncbi:21096_t:CDS:2 [Rhizophagus irregularis]|nr:21096_t:CDS:2 [Rhizophagus irregularis]
MKSNKVLRSKKQKKVATKKNINKTLKSKPSKSSSIKSSLRESEKSKCRLKAAWADIIKRYQNISPEQTDVIDLVTEEIVVDRGILQKDNIRYVGTLDLHASKPQEDAIDDDSIWQPDPNLYVLLEGSNECFDWETESSDYNEFNENLGDIDESFDEMSNIEEESEVCRKNNSSFEKESLKITNKQSSTVTSLRKNDSDKTNDIIDVLLEGSNESFDWEIEPSDYNEFYENLRDNESFDEMSNTEEESEVCRKNDSSFENESLKITNGRSNSVTLTEIPSSQSTESITQSNSSRRLKVYSFNTFDSGHESEKKNLDYTQEAQQETLNHCQMTQQETLNYSRVIQQGTVDYSRMTQQESVNYYQVTQQETLNYCKMQSIDHSQREILEFIQTIPPASLTQEQQRLWLEPTSEDYTQLLTWTDKHVGHGLLN